jgi:hypothetical protein
MANELARGPTRAYGLVKRLLYGAATNPLYEQMELERIDRGYGAQRRCAGRYQRLSDQAIAAIQRPLDLIGKRGFICHALLSSQRPEGLRS